MANIITEDRASGALVIDGSLKFNSSSDQYLTKTFGSAGNRKTNTVSFWMKRYSFGDDYQRIFNCDTASNALQEITLNNEGGSNSDNLISERFISSQSRIRTNALLRDTGWYHVVVVYDTSRGYQANRQVIYINGQRQSTNNSVSVGQNNDGMFSSANEHRIGRGRNYPVNFNGSLSNFYFVDGQALGPGYFGYTDPFTNTWRPKKFKAEGTTVNNGTDWSATIGDFTNGGNVFNGTVTDQGYANNTGVTTLTTGKFVIKNNLRLLHNFRSDGTYNLIINGVSINVPGEGTNSGDYRWSTVDISALQLPITVTSLKYYISQTSGNSIRAIEVDSNIMVDSTTTNLAFGTNGFYLPFDGNSPIGEDKSGNGNNWTPVNFGGSVALDNPIVSGALPILNTDGGGNVARVGVRTDAYHANLVLALPLVGSANDVSNQINSGSTTKTTSDSTTHNSFGNFYGGSATFANDAKNDAVDYSGDLTLGTGDFTLELWVFRVGDGSQTSFETIFDCRTTDNPDTGFAFGFNSSGEIRTYGVPSGTGAISRGSGANNGWNHLAIVRGGGTIRVYQNGIQKSSVAEGSSNYSQGGFRLGAANASVGSGDWNLNARLQDVRLYKGVAKYTSNFIPAATNPDILPDTPSGVSGSSKLAKVTEGAVYFDGTGDFLSLASSTDFGLVTQDWTVECYAYIEQMVGSYGRLWYLEGSSAADIDGVYFSNTHMSMGSTNVWSVGDGTGGEYSRNKWMHVAVCHDSTNMRMYIDGVQALTSTNNFYNSASKKLTLMSTNNGSYAGTGQGYLSNFRIVNGTALYTTDFTPPIRELTNVTNTKLLCCQSNKAPGDATIAPLVSGVNSGTNWSAYLSGGGGFQASYPVTNAFNGVTTGANTSRSVDSQTTQTFTPPGGISYSSSVEVWTWMVGTVSLNGGSNIAVSNDQSFRQIASGSGTIDSISFTSASGNSVYIAGIKVDSTILVDPITPYGDTAATNFNPFNTDINTVRGQETGYATLNPLRVNEGAITLSNGNLTASRTDSSEGRVAGTMTLSTGKFYFEVKRTRNSSIGNYFAVGVTSTEDLATTQYGGNPTSSGGSSLEWVLTDRATAVNSSTYTNLNSTLGNVVQGDVVQVCIDMDTSKIWFGKNGIFSGTPQSGSGQAFSNLPSEVTPLCYIYSEDLNWNFGQKPFKFPPPDGYQPLNAANVRPETVITRPDQYIGVSLYTGNGGTLSVTNLNFKPDLVWIKCRSDSDDHTLTDSVRGADRALYSNSTNSEHTSSIRLQSFNDDGFTTGSSGDTNTDDRTFCAWSWKAGGNKNTFNVDDVGYASAAAAGLDGGTITPTGCSVGTKQGFSIISYSGATNATTDSSTNSGNPWTIPHGLGQKPAFMIFKNRSAHGWYIYHQSRGATKHLLFNTAAEATGTVLFRDTEPTSDFINVGGWDVINRNSNDYISYIWHDVPGLQKFGTYEGNGDADGPFIELGFRPAVVLTKNADAVDDWSIADSSRSPHNVAGESLRPNSNASEDSSADIDILSNGFKIRQGNSHRINYDGETFIYAAWAEAPTFNLYGGQSNAR